MIWYTLISANLLPTSHNTSVTRQRLVLPDHILDDRSVNFEKIIHRQFFNCAKKTKCAVSFFSHVFFSELCKELGTTSYDSDDLYQLSVCGS